VSVVLARTASVVFGAIAMLSFLLAVASFSFGRSDGVIFYVVVAVVSSYVVARLMRRDVQRRRASGELPPRRVPRQPIAFPVRETALAFAFWYAVAVVVDRLVTGAVNVFTLIAIAPFAAFILATLTIAGRHMAFRLTAEEEER
jgi:hypothetical protein